MEVSDVKKIIDKKIELLMTENDYKQARTILHQAISQANMQLAKSAELGEESTKHLKAYQDSILEAQENEVVKLEEKYKKLKEEYEAL